MIKSIYLIFMTLKSDTDSQMIYGNEMGIKAAGFVDKH